MPISSASTPFANRSLTFAILFLYAAKTTVIQPCSMVQQEPEDILVAEASCACEGGLVTVAGNKTIRIRALVQQVFPKGLPPL